MRERRQAGEKRNQGFSLFAVIITVSFIGILAMLVLYISVANFHMKTTGLAGTDSFYTAEQALEEVRTGLLHDVGNAMSEAYIRVLETYDADESSSTDAALDEKRQERFLKLYNELLTKRLAKGTDSSRYDLERLKSYVDLYSQPGFDPDSETLVVTTPAGEEPWMLPDQNAGVLLKNLKVIYVDPRGRASVIQTDIRLSVPKVQFPTPSTLPDLMNMIIVANGGIICKKGAEGEQTVIQGSVSAGEIKEVNDAGGKSGVSVYLEDHARLSVLDGDKLVCTGSVDTDTGGRFQSEAAVTLWASGINVASAGSVELLGKTYLSDDLTVEQGSGSKVTIAGEYYGYGYPESARKSRNNVYIEEKQKTDTALSSAIMINGRNAVLDLSGLNKLMLAGKSYISPAKSNVVKQDASDILTGESLTVKGTQVAYLVPSELIGDGLYSNPMSYDEYNNLIGKYGADSFLMMNESVDAWGGLSLSQIGLSADKPCRVVFQSHPQGNLVYIYLNFGNDASASRFMQQYYKNNPDLKEKMDRYLAFYLNSGEIRLPSEKNFLRFITNGNVMESKKEEGQKEQTYAMRDATDGAPGKNLLQEQIDYQNMWYALNRKMIGSCDLLKNEVADSDGITHSELDPNRSVFDNLVNEKEMVLFLEKSIENNSNRVDKNEKLYTFSASDAEDNLQAIMVNNGPKGVTYQVKAPGWTQEQPVYQEKVCDGTDRELVITQEKAQRLRLVVSTGDVRILSGVEFRGIIMAKGKITLESGAKLISAPLEAARVFQAQNVEEQVAPKTFFWEGDKYVLGNTSSAQEEGAQKASDVFSVSDCISYENWRKR